MFRRRLGCPCDCRSLPLLTLHFRQLQGAASDFLDQAGEALQLPKHPQHGDDIDQGAFAGREFAVGFPRDPGFMGNDVLADITLQADRFNALADLTGDGVVGH